MIVTITGENDLLRRQALDERISTFTAEYGDVAIERFDGEETAAERMKEGVQSLPFLSPRKLVVLREPSKQKLFAETIAATLADVADTTDLILYEPKLDKRGTYYKTLKKSTDFQEYTELGGAGLAQWAGNYVAAAGGSLKPADAQFLVDRLGTNQLLLKSELDKLLAYSPEVTRQTIELLSEPMPQSTVFDLLDAAFSGNTAKSFALYAEQRALKVEPQAIIGMLAWQLHVMAVVKVGDARTTEQIAQAAKLNPYVVRKAQTLTRRTTLRHIKKLISDLLLLDVELKRSAVDADEALQFYLLNLSVG